MCTFYYLNYIKTTTINASDLYSKPEFYGENETGEVKNIELDSNKKSDLLKPLQDPYLWNTVVVVFYKLSSINLTVSSSKFFVTSDSIFLSKSCSVSMVTNLTGAYFAASA